MKMPKKPLFLSITEISHLEWLLQQPVRKDLIKEMLTYPKFIDIAPVPKYPPYIPKIAEIRKKNEPI